MIYIYYLSALELALLGSGQLLQIQGITIRMFLFAVLVSFSLTKMSLNKTHLQLLLIFLFSTGISSAVGLLSGASLPDILNDLKPLAFFLYILPLSHFLKNPIILQNTVKIIRGTALFLAVIYLLYVSFLRDITIFKFSAIYLQTVGELFFRTSGFFFYKGFLYLVIGFFLHIYSNVKFKYGKASLILIAILFTYTRGLLLALFGAIILLALVEVLSSKKIKKWALLIWGIGILAGIKLVPIIIDFFGDKSASDGTRFTIVEQVFKSVNPLSFFIGHGFGIGVDIRKEHMEIAFLEIFHKQGLLGLFFWSLILVQAVVFYLNTPNEKKETMKPFLLSILSIYIISMTNPFVNNPIGLFPLLISYIVLSYEKNLSLHSNL